MALFALCKYFNNSENFPECHSKFLTKRKLVDVNGRREFAYKWRYGGALSFVPFASL